MAVELLGRLQPAASAAGFVVGAVYNRRRDIHNRFSGQQQGGIITPRGAPLVIAITGGAGLQHGYFDRWDDAGDFHYYGEGQDGDMQLTRGNKAISDHVKNGKQLLVFQALGTGGQHRFLGQFVCLDYYVKANTPTSEGKLRKAIVFRLRPVQDTVGEELPAGLQSVLDVRAGDATVRQVLTTVRTKQDLFRRRLATIELGCRLTNVYDLRFLRASHIKPWAASDDHERVDRNNGLLLTPSADLLFDHGWISFGDGGDLMVSGGMPDEITDRVGLDLTQGRDCGAFTAEQKTFLEYHRDCVFGQREFQDRLSHEQFD